MEPMEKPLTEAQRIIARLRDEFGMAGASIADAIKVKPGTVHDITRRKSTGNLQLYKLRRLIAALEAPGNAPENTADAIAPTFPDIVPDASPTSEFPDPASASLNAEEPEPPEKKGLFDRVRAAMLGHATDPLSPLSGPSMTAPPRSRTSGKASDDRQASFVEQVTPMAALAIAIVFTWLIHDPYKPVAPTQTEAMLMIQPIIRRAARELDIQQKLTEGTMELMSVALALGLYAQRAYGTYQQIHEMEVERAGRDGHGNNAAPTFPAFSQPAAGTPGDAGAGRGGADGNQPVARRAATVDRAAASGHGRRADGSEPAGANGHTNASIAQLLQADAEGRRRLGL